MMNTTKYDKAVTICCYFYFTIPKILEDENHDQLLVRVVITTLLYSIMTLQFIGFYGAQCKNSIIFLSLRFYSLTIKFKSGTNKVL